MKEINGRYKEIALRLRAVRGYYDLNQKEFAEAVGVPQKSYSQWESGDFRISIQGALKLRDSFNVSLDFIYCGSLEALSQNLTKALSESPLLKASSASNVNRDEQAV